MTNKDKIVTFDDMKILENKDDVLIIDVREPSEIQKTGKIGGSINIPLNELEKALKNINEDEFKGKYGKPKPIESFPLIFSCMLGGRAAKALALAEKLGFNDVRYYKGSWKEWEEKLKQN
ncbi:heat shock protein 67B2-like [Anoplophora glabripennis]|uniref:heat shock protein 67B2-like n=1 Tax=Anoplophora glabripennis TaxID=217634 RepID=UPI0008757D33|nr:heat shock protein 67B2-like [Anoplophora glabripennis]